MAGARTAMTTEYSEQVERITDNAERQAAGFEEAELHREGMVGILTRRQHQCRLIGGLRRGTGGDFDQCLVGDAAARGRDGGQAMGHRSEEHTSELQSLMRISYAVFCLKKKKDEKTQTQTELRN